MKRLLVFGGSWMLLLSGVPFDLSPPVPAQSPDCPTTALSGDLDEDTSYSGCDPIVIDGNIVVHGRLLIEASTVDLVGPEASLEIGPTGSLDWTDVVVHSTEDITQASIRFNSKGESVLERVSFIDAFAEFLSVQNGHVLAKDLQVVPNGHASIRVQGPGEVAFIGGDISMVQLVVTQTEGESPEVRLVGTRHDPAGFSPAVGTTIEVDWPVRFELSSSPNGTTQLQDIQVRVRAPDAKLLVSGLTPGDEGKTEPVVLPAIVHTGEGGPHVMGPYLAVASLDRNAAHEILDPSDWLDSDSKVIVNLELGADEDFSPPIWPDGAGFHQVADFPGYSSDGTLRWVWNEADDTKEMEHPTRAIEYYTIEWGGGHWSTRDTKAILKGMPEGLHSFTLRAVDLVGEIATSGPVQVLVDKSPPRLEFLQDENPVPAGRHATNASFEISFEAQDDGSGIAALRYKINEVGPLRSYNGPLWFDREGTYFVEVVALDKAGNLAEKNVTFLLDRTPPVIHLKLSPPFGEGPDGWYKERPLLVASAEDDRSGVAGIQWRIGDGPWNAYNGSVSVGRPGAHLLQVQAVDQAGNKAIGQVRLAWDPGAPVITLTPEGRKTDSGWYATPVEIHGDVETANSPIVRTEHRHVGLGDWTPMESPITLSGSGIHSIEVSATNRAGNQTVERETFRVDVDPPVAPVVRWIPMGDGVVIADWSGAPPVDAHSGLDGLKVEQADASGLIIASHAGDPFAANARLEDISTGEHRFRVVVTDRVGHEAASVWTSLFVHGPGSMEPDRPPTTARGVIAVEYEPDEGEAVREVRFYLDGSLVEALGQEPWRWIWDTRMVADGPHNVRIEAIDTTGVHREAFYEYNVRNGYGLTVMDHFPSFTVAAGLTTFGFIASCISLFGWRRLSGA